MDIVYAAPRDRRSEDWVRALQQALPDDRVHLWQPGAPCSDAQIAVAWMPPPEFFASTPHLRYLFNRGAGVDALLRLPGLPDDLCIVRLEDGGMAAQMAEYALYYVLKTARGFDHYAAQQRRAHWQQLEGLQRAAWPVGIMGGGEIGRHVVRAFTALDYPVAVWSRSGAPVPGAQQVFAGQAALPAFLARTRVLVNVLPLTDRTRGILCRATFEQLLPDAFVINMARGPHLVEADLLACLEAGRLRGAALDVFVQEPLPVGHPFWSHPRIDVTPHVSGVTLLEPTVHQIAGKIRALARGETITGIVDRTRQY